MTLQQQGAYQIQSIAAKPLNGFSGTISLTATGLPAGITIISSNIPSFSPPSGSSFQMAASSGAVVGSNTITVTATSGSISHSATFSASVVQAAPFAIQLSPNPLTMTPGTKVNVKVSATANAGSSPQLSINISPPYSIPAGVNIGSPQFLLTPAKPVSFFIQAAVSAQPIQNFPLVVTAADNSNNSSVAVLPVSVSVPFASSGAATRSNFARTDQGPTGAVYDQARKLLFVSVEVLNQVAVFSSIDGHRVATIPVMYPAGIDESIDGSEVYVVSPFSSFITTIDPSLFQVVHQTSIPQNQPGLELAALSTGEVMLLVATDATGTAPVYLWNPATGAFSGIGQFRAAMRRSADRSRVLFYDVDSTGASATLYDVASQSIISNGTLNGVYHIAISPDGSHIVGFALGGSPTVFYDDKFNLLGSISLGLFPISDVLYSLDGSHVYALGADPFAGNVVGVLDPQTFSLVGVVPSFNFGTGLPFSGQSLAPLVMDETNMLFGAASLGMEYLDVSSPGLINLPVFGTSLVQPTLLSLGAPTQVHINGEQFSSTSHYNVYFGAPPASMLAQKGANLSVPSTTQISVSAPTGVSPGPANVTVTRSDGFFQVMPDAVSYGPTILMVDPNAGSPVGGDLINIVGYGFDGSNVEVTIGGKQATITEVMGAIPDKLFPTERITVKTPAGTGDADVTVTTPVGTTTRSDGFQYIASLETYPITGALDDVIYDQARRRLYLTNEDHNRVEIFDLTSKSYLTPIPVGNQPTGLALTPDSAFLAVVNSGEGTISVIDPNKTQVLAKWSALATGETPSGSIALTIASATPHRVLVDVYYPAVIFGGAIHVLNLDTGSLSCTGYTWCANGTNLSGFTLAAMASIPDGSRVFLADMTGGAVGMLDLTANTLTRGFSGSFSDAAADADGNVFAGSLGIFNAHLSRIDIMAYEPYAVAGDVRFGSVFGEKLNPSGSLLFMPQTSGVDIFDVHTGRLVRHMALPTQSIPVDLSGLALDETGTKMFLISNSGVTIAELSDAPLSLASVSPSAAAPGIQVRVRGSGYQEGATVTFGTSQAVTTFVDQNTLLATVPALSPGPIQVTVTNPDGHTYSFDAALVVQ